MRTYCRVLVYPEPRSIGRDLLRLPGQLDGAFVAPLASTYFNMRKTTIYGGSNEVQRNIVAQTVLGS